ncbi:MAG: hypothetical protein IKR04_04340 [Clostridia bacterium]|nr:hypothetical protein [Clostridia bacterium]
MKNFKRIFSSVLLILVMSAILGTSVIYADHVAVPTISDYTASYYYAMVGIIALVLFICILIIVLIYRSNKKNAENKEEVKEEPAKEHVEAPKEATDETPAGESSEGSSEEQGGE